MSKYFDEAIKSLRTPLCEGKGIQVFRIYEGGTNLYPEGKLRRSKNDVEKHMGFTEVRVMKKGSEVYHGGNMGNTTKHVGENVDKMFSKGTFAKMRKEKISEEGSPDYMYVLQTKYRPGADLKEGEGEKCIRCRKGTMHKGDTMMGAAEKCDRCGYQRQLKENEGPRYPDISVQLTGNDGNAMAIIGNITRALKRARVDREEIDAFTKEAMSGDYDNVLQTAMKWVDVS